MKQNTVVENKKPETFIDDPLTAIVRQGARDILAKALVLIPAEFALESA